MKVKNKRIYSKWRFWIILALAAIALCLILIISFREEKCGSFTTAAHSSNEDCSCIGIKDTKEMLGGGPVYCHGICLESTCKNEKERIDLSDFHSKKIIVLPSKLKMMPETEEEIQWGLKNFEESSHNFAISISCAACKSQNEQNKCDITYPVKLLFYDNSMILSAGQVKAAPIWLTADKGLSNQVCIYLITVLKEDGSLYAQDKFWVELIE